MRQVDGKTITRGAIIALAVGAVSIYALNSLGSQGNPLAALSKFPRRYLVWSLLSAIALWLVQAWRIQILTKAYGRQINLLHSLGVYLGATFVAHITPFSAGGIPMNIYLLTRRGLTGVTSSAITMVMNSLTLAFLLLLSPMLLLVNQSEANVGGTGIFGTFAGVLILTALCVYILAKPLVAKALMTKVLRQGPLGRLFKRLKKSDSIDLVIKQSTDWLQEFDDSLVYLWRQGKWTLILSCLLSGAYWVAYVLTVPIIFAGMGIEIGIVAAVLPQLIFSFFQAFIPTPGGSGGAELGIAFMYSDYIPHSQVAGFVLLWRFFTYYLRLVVGGIALAMELRVGKRLRGIS